MRSSNIKSNRDLLKADGHVLGNAKCSSKVLISLNNDLYMLGLDSHGRSNHLARDLSASRQGSQQQFCTTDLNLASSRVGWTITIRIPPRVQHRQTSLLPSSLYSRDRYEKWRSNRFGRSKTMYSEDLYDRASFVGTAARERRSACKPGPRYRPKGLYHFWPSDQ
jgi:hypothetical protein